MKNNKLNISLMGNCTTTSNNKQQIAPKVEKKIELDPKLVRPAPPEFRRCGADDLKITPGIISKNPINPINPNINNNINANINNNLNNNITNNINNNLINNNLINQNNNITTLNNANNNLNPNNNININNNFNSNPNWKNFY